MSSMRGMLGSFLKGKRSDIDFLEFIFRLYGDTVYRAAFYVLQDAALAEDVTQETFIIAYQKLSQVKNPEKVKAWLSRVAINKAIDISRKSKAFIPLDKVARQLEAEQDIENIIIFKETLHEVEEAILALQNIYQTVFYLRYYLQFSIQEIAESLDIPENTVKSRLKKIKRTVAVHLKRTILVP